MAARSHQSCSLKTINAGCSWQYNLITYINITTFCMVSLPKIILQWQLFCIYRYVREWNVKVLRSFCNPTKQTPFLKNYQDKVIFFSLPILNFEKILQVKISVELLIMFKNHAGPKEKSTLNLNYRKLFGTIIMLYFLYFKHIYSKSFSFAAASIQKMYIHMYFLYLFPRLLYVICYTRSMF